MNMLIRFALGALLVASVGCAHVTSRSNEFTARLQAIDARFNPEAADDLGVTGVDEAIADFAPNVDERALAEYRAIEQFFRAALSQQTDSSVRLDLELLIDAAHKNQKRIELNRKYGISTIEAADVVFAGLNGLLSDRATPEQHRAALVRLRKYVGEEANTTPLTTLMAARIRERLAASSTPFILRVSLERYLGGWRESISGLQERFTKHGISGAEPLLAKLESQLTEYETFLRNDVMPRAQTDLRRPEELYAFELENTGVDIEPRALITLARSAFVETQQELQRVAQEVAAKRGWAFRDYRDVLRALKKDQVQGAELVRLYERRMADIEKLIVEHELATLPKRPLKFRFASEAESQSIPAPRYQAPPLLSKSDEPGTFVLPQHGPQALAFDDFSSEASSWWLTAHEGRPGHDLQYARMLEAGVSTARAIYAFNSVNAEGWGLYAESLLEPHVSPEAKLAILQARLMRQAHAFLDPEINLGLISADAAKRVMTDDVVFSEAWATSCVQRYSVWMPSQAPSYFYGYVALLALRRDAERAWGAQYSLKRFNDEVVAQGFLSPRLVREALLHPAR